MLPNISETGDVRRDSRSATVAIAAEGGATGEHGSCGRRGGV